jgi:hypothetical protein
MQTAVSLVLAAIAVLFFSVLLVKMRGRRGRPGSAAAGATYDLLNEDKRKALEIIVEQRAEMRDPEDKDGDLPQLEKPGKR